VHLQFPAHLTAEDYIEAQRLHAGWRMFIRLSLLMFIIMVGLVATVSELGPERFYAGPVIWLIWLAIFRASYPQSVARRARKTFLQRADLQLPYTATITDDMLTMSVPGRGEWSSPWREALKWKTNEKMTLVYPSDNTFRMFPRHWFASNTEFAEFKALLEKTVGSAGKSRQAAS
jgi:hypothetical protein